MTDSESDTKPAWAGIISATKTPIGLFALVLLVVEAVLGVVAMTSTSEIKSYISIGMLLGFLGVIVIVALLAFFRPMSLHGLSGPSQGGDNTSRTDISERVVRQIALLGQDADRQKELVAKIEDALTQLFPAGSPPGVEPREWQFVMSLVRESRSLAESATRTARELEAELESPSRT